MSKIRIALLVLLCLAASMAAQAANLIVNGDFSTAPAIPGAKAANAWYVTYGSSGGPTVVPLSYATQAAVFTPGPTCQFMSSNAYMTTLRYWTGQNGVTPGRTYTFSFQYKATGSGFALGGPNTSGDTSTCQLQEIAYSGLSTIVNGSTGYGNFPPITVATGNNWTTYSKTFTTEDTVDNIVFKFNVAMGLGNNTPGIGYIQDMLQVDNVSLIAHPLVVITSPTTNSAYETTASTVNISGTASADSAFTSVTWTNDRGGSGTCTGTTSWSATGIALQNGDNIITVSTTDAAGKTGTDVICVSKVVPLPVGPVITDNFNRTASAIDPLGSASSTGTPSSYPWTRGIYNGVIDPRVSIDGDKLLLGTGPNCWSGVFIDGLLTRDFDAKFNISSTYVGDADWTGIQYRGMKPMYAEYQTGNDTAGDPAAYILRFYSRSPNSNKYTVNIDSSQTGVIASASTNLDFSTPHLVRLKVVGSRHRVWIDNILDTNTPVLDVINTNNTGAGYFEVCRRDSPTSLDNLNIQLHDAYGTVSGTVRNATTNAVIPGADVTILGKTVTTASNGTYSVSGLISGDWQMNVIADGYNAFSKTTTVTANGTTTENVSLTPAPATSIYDTFTRDDSRDLGTTEDARQCPWIKSNPDSGTSIAYGTLSFPEGVSDAITLGGGVFPSDFDLTANYSSGSYSAMGYAGFAYRCSLKGLEDANGYSVRIDPDMNTITLMGHSAQLATTTIPYGEVDFYAIPGPSVEVRVIGNRHRVWVNGTNYIDYTDTSSNARTSGGYLNILNSSVWMVLDNFNLTAWGAPIAGSVTGLVTAGGSPVSGAEVVVPGFSSVTTGTSGTYTISDIIAGPQVVTASKPGLYADLKTITVPSGGTVTQNLELTALPAGAYADTFTRTDAADLGTTEDASHTAWLKNDAVLTISNNGLAAAANGPTYATASLQGVQLKNFEVSFDATLLTMSNAFVGIMYRVPEQVTNTNANHGYLMEFNPVKVYLWNYDTGHLAGPDNLFTLGIPHRFKLRVEDSRHRCWIDDTLVYDVTNEFNTNAGYICLIRCNGAASWDNFKLESLDSTGTPAANTRAAKDLGPGQGVVLQEAIIIGKYDSQGFFYVEDSNRAGGIKVVGTTSEAVGTKVSVTGTTGSENGEMFITAASGGVSPLPGGSALDPVVVNGREFDLTSGLSATGLLVKVAGNVTAVDTANHIITIDDGSGVTCYAWYGTGFTVPSAGDTIICRGCAGRTASGPVIWMQSPADLQKVAP